MPAFCLAPPPVGALSYWGGCYFSKWAENDAPEDRGDPGKSGPQSPVSADQGPARAQEEAESRPVAGSRVCSLPGTGRSVESALAAPQ